MKQMSRRNKDQSGHQCFQQETKGKKKLMKPEGNFFGEGQ